MSADVLRQAAEILREQAASATQGQWHADGSEVGSLFVGLGIWADVVSDAEARPQDATYIATMHPGVGLALAKWLDDIAAGWIWDDDPEDVETPDGWPVTLEESMDSHALAVACLVLGGAS